MAKILTADNCHFYPTQTLIKEVCIINCIFCRNLLCCKKLLPLKYSIDCSRDKITAYDNYLLMRNIDKGRAFLLQKMLWSCAV